MTGEEEHTLPPDVDAPVLIAGAGPVGMVLALELAMHQVNSVLVERNPDTTTFPKMDLTNVRSMELMRRWGPLDDIRRAGVGEQYSFDVIFTSGLDGYEYGRWDLPSQKEMRDTISASNDGSQAREPWQRISQERMEAVLMKRCLDSPFIDVRRPWSVVAVHQDADGAVTTIRSPGGEEQQLRSTFVAGCDGAHSVVRRSTDIELEGERSTLGTSCQVHFRSRDVRTLHRFGQFWHIFMARPIGRVVIVAQDEQDTWTMQASVPAGTTVDEIDPVEFLRLHTSSAIEVDEILKHSVWQPQALVASSYRDRRLFLAGDAAHQYIPTGGYGMNTGVGDAVDLGWKLSAVINGWGGERLLDSYDAERRPVGVANRDRAVHNARVHSDAAQIVGADADLLAQDSEAGAGLRARLTAHYAERRGENESFGTELGYGYPDSPVVTTATDEDEIGTISAADPLVYTPTACPGARAPHVFLSADDSIIDNFTDRFTLVDFGADPRAVADIVAAARDLGVPMKHVTIGSRSARELYRRDLVIVRPDGHVAWRSDHGPDSPADLIATVVGR
ncbi:FAD-dependent monooxygenase [Gordonia terrae]